ncbi:RimJ/RimL family protein N-acetyltransferase [Undibacterium sp. GrIS 1.8]
MMAESAMRLKNFTTSDDCLHMSLLHTQRLRLEPFNDEHLDGLFRLNSDPEVMRYITGKPETREETIAMIERIKARWIEFGFSWWSFIELETNELIGAGCIQYLGRDPANPLEIGWRLRQDKWGQGFASEAAQRMAAFAFDQIGGDSLFAVCDQENIGSANVMKKLGMQYRGIERWYDMDTLVYTMTRADWEAKKTR